MGKRQGSGRMVGNRGVDMGNVVEGYKGIIVTGGI